MGIYFTLGKLFFNSLHGGIAACCHTAGSQTHQYQRLAAMPQAIPFCFGFVLDF